MFWRPTVFLNIDSTLETTHHLKFQRKIKRNGICRMFQNLLANKFATNLTVFPKKLTFAKIVCSDFLQFRSQFSRFWDHALPAGTHLSSSYSA